MEIILSEDFECCLRHRPQEYFLLSFVSNFQEAFRQAGFGSFCNITGVVAEGASQNIR
jgi:hypothetical protein